ncbi:hypothetical protein AA309_29010 [Microvirga vignae]|uniref:Uncharacterized protein n=1 Tax=Microvirga vignae TaxID=1225564 RepID=A0A0H1R418_9HYPH|nr:hypothetical protein AA309_29010 [Microvirga vignae]
MRFFTVVAALGLLLLPEGSHSEEKTDAESNASRLVRLSPADRAAQSAAMAKEARDKAEALERARDRKMREISKGICTGC